MSNKAELVALIRRSADCVDGEGALLQAWSLIASADRAAACRLVRRAIMMGEGSARFWVQDVLRRAQGIPAEDVIEAPTAAHEDMTSHTEDSLAARTQLNVNTLTANQFQTALVDAQSNAYDCCDNADEAYADCTGES